MDYEDEFVVPLLLIGLALVFNLGALSMSRRGDVALSTVILLVGVFWILLRKRS